MNLSKQKLLDLLKERVEKELDCSLKKEANNLVFGKGSSDAEIFFIGEAPGKEEDLQGIPFVGRSGKELDKQLRRIDLSLDEVYIANILKYRPPKNRNPTSKEIQKHTPYLIEQINIIKPKYLVTLGNYATKFVLSGFSQKGMSKIEGIASLHGRKAEVVYEEKTYFVFPIYHPAAMMYNGKVRGLFEKDFLILASLLSEK